MAISSAIVPTKLLRYKILPISIYKDIIRTVTKVNYINKTSLIIIMNLIIRFFLHHPEDRK